jgi:hypothetical protein
MSEEKISKTYIIAMMLLLISGIMYTISTIDTMERLKNGSLKQRGIERL